MDRARSPDVERGASVRADRVVAFDVLLRCCRRKRREPAVDASYRRAVFKGTIFRQPQDGGSAGLQPQANPTADATDGAPSNISPETDHLAGGWAQDIPLFTAKCSDYSSGPRMEHGHHLHPHAAWFSVPGRRDGLVQSLRAFLATVEHAGRNVLPGSVGRSVGAWPTGDFQHRSREPIHSDDVHESAGVMWHSDQHGRPRPGDRQRIHRASVAEREVRGSLLEELRDGVGGGRLVGELLPFLLPRSRTPVARLPDAGRSLFGDRLKPLAYLRRKKHHEVRRNKMENENEPRAGSSYSVRARPLEGLAGRQAQTTTP